MTPVGSMQISRKCEELPRGNTRFFVLFACFVWALTAYQDVSAADNHPDSGLQETYNEWGKEASGFVLSLRSKKVEFTLGEDIEVSVVLKNVSNRNVRVEFIDPAFDNKFSVKTVDGHDAPLTAYGKKMQHAVPRVIVNMMIKPFAPHEEYKTDVNLSSIFDLSQLGTYTVTVKRGVPKIDGQGLEYTTSNTVTIKVTKPN